MKFLNSGLRTNGLKKLYCEENPGWIEGIHTFKSEEFEIIDILSRDYPVYKLCELMEVSRAGYYKWKNHEPTNRDIKRNEILSIVEDVHKKHSTHGYRWTAAYIRINYVYDFSDNYIY